VLPTRGLGHVQPAAIEPAEGTNGGFDTARAAVGVEVRRDFEADLALRRARVVEDLLVGVDGFGLPARRDLGEPVMLDGIPFGGASR
jgi:hypothetical protein